MIPTDSPGTGPAVVLDTNAVLDWLVFDDPGMHVVAAAIRDGALRWLASPRMREELVRTLSYPSLARWNPDGERTLTAFDSWAKLCAEPIASTAGPLCCTDPDDQVFIDLAVQRQAQWLISHDRALHKLARHAARLGVQIVKPRDWAPRGTA
jgi:putative PIN family toxin of toxin-antitoxin system